MGSEKCKRQELIIRITNRGIRNTKLGFWNTKLGIWNTKIGIRNTKLGIRNTKLENRNQAQSPVSISIVQISKVKSWISLQLMRYVMLVHTSLLCYSTMAKTELHTAFYRCPTSMCIFSVLLYKTILTFVEQKRYRNLFLPL